MNRTGIVISNGEVRPAEMRRDLDRTLRLGGFCGDEPPGNEALGAVAAQEKELSEDLNGPEGLLALVEKLGPLNQNLTSEAFIKPFFQRLNLSQLNIVSLDADLAKFTKLTNLDISRNSISAVDFLSPNLKFLKAYNNSITKVTCAQQPSLCFLGAGYNALASAGMPQIVQRFRGLVSLDLCYNNITGLRPFLDEVTALDRLKHLCMAGNPLCLLPFYRLVLIKHLPQLQLLDEQAVGEGEVADSQLVEDGHRDIPQCLNVEISFSQVTFLKRLLLPLALELPDKKMEMSVPQTKGEEPVEVEVQVSEEDRISEVAQKGCIFFRFELPGNSEGDETPYIDTVDVPIEAPPPEIDPKAKAAPKGKEVEVEAKPPGEPIDLLGLKRPLEPPPASALDAAPDAAEATEAEAPPTEAQLLFPIPLASSDGSDGFGGLLKLRDWLTVGMPVKVLYRKNKEPVDPDAAPPPDLAEGEEAPPPPEVIEEAPRLLGGGVLPLSSALWPRISPLSDEVRQESKLPALPPSFSIAPEALSLAPVSKWLEPDVQVPDAPASKSLSDVSAIVTMDVILYGREPASEQDGGS